MSILYFANNHFSPVISGAHTVTEITSNYLYIQGLAGNYTVDIYTTAANNPSVFNSLQESHSFTLLNQGGYELTLNHAFENGEKYFINITAIDSNKQVVIEKFYITFDIVSYVFVENRFNVMPNADRGRIELVMELAPIPTADSDTILQLTFIRDDEEEIYQTTIEDLAISHRVSINDYASVSGIKYKYSAILKIITPDNTSIQSFNAFGILDLDDIFLGAQGEIIKIKFNPKITNFKRNIKETFSETLGARYPFVRRNGAVNYHSFTLGGLIAYENEEFNFIDEIADSYAREREYRNQIMEFLYKNNIKLFKSAQEGNMLIKLSNISFSPEEQLGRLVYSFSCTITEMMEATPENIAMIMKEV